MFHLVIKRNHEDVILWHDRLSHSGTTMMQNIIENSHGQSMKNQDKKFRYIYVYIKLINDMCSLEVNHKAITNKIDKESPKFLE